MKERQRVRSVNLEDSTMSDELKIGFIGAGKMASALAGGFVRKHQVKVENLIASDPIGASRDSFAEITGGRTTDSNAEVASFADLIFLAVKPDRCADALQSIHAYWRESQCLISIVAGLSTDHLAFYLPAGGRIIRVMPNTPALVGASASALCLGEFATATDAEQALILMSAIGTVERVPESMMDAVTGLSGSGPAYVYQFIEALSDGAVAAGLTRDQATRLAAQTVLGSARMVHETGAHPGLLKDMVTSPGGTTIEGIHELEKGGMRAAVMNAVRAAASKSRKLGRRSAGPRPTSLT